MLKKFTVYITATGTGSVQGVVDILPVGNPGRYYVATDANTDSVQPRAATYNDGFARLDGDGSSGIVGPSSSGVIVLGPSMAMAAAITSQGIPGMTSSIITIEQLPEGVLV